MHEAGYWINTASVKFRYFNQSVRCSKLFLVFSSNLCTLYSCAWFNLQMDHVQVSIACESLSTSFRNTYAVSTQGHPSDVTHNRIWHAREQFGSQEDHYPQGHSCSYFQLTHLIEVQRSWRITDRNITLCPCPWCLPCLGWLYPSHSRGSNSSSNW